mgnify:CR=1 FL=1
MSLKYKLISQIADIRLKVEADDLLQLFVIALEGMNSIMKEKRDERGEKRKRIISVGSPDETALLVDFLNEVLYQSHTNKEIYEEIRFLEFSETALKAEIYGQEVDGFDEDIKAATYHEADIVKNKNNNWETIIVFDI